MRAVIVLSHPLLVRNFVASGWLAGFVSRGHETTVVVPNSVVEDVSAALAALDPRPDVVPLERFGHGSFKGALRRRFRVWSFARRSAHATYAHKLALLRRRWRTAPDAIAAGIAGKFIDLESLALKIESLLPVSAEALRFADETRPDIVFAPTLIHLTGDAEMLKAFRRRGVPIVAFAGTWDTLTSKGMFLVAPDHLLVWGPANREQAVAQHHLPPARVTVTGAPHWDVYGESADVTARDEFLSARGIDPSRKVILFAGTSINYMADEPEQVRALSEAIGNGVLGDTVIWYRPHPRRQTGDFWKLRDLPGVYVDDQVLRLRHDRPRGGGWSLNPDDLWHYRSLMEACDAGVTAFSTMIVELAMFGKPSLVVGFGSDVSGRGGIIKHAGYEHMLEVIRTPGVRLCASLDELIAGIRDVGAGKFDGHRRSLMALADRVARNRDGRARERITRALEAIAAGESVARGA